MSAATVVARTGRAEWTRIWSVRSSWLLVLVTALAVLGLGTLVGLDAANDLSGAPPDYRHYAEKQLAPIADMVLRFYGTDFQAVTQDSTQLSIF